MTATITDIQTAKVLSPADELRAQIERGEITTPEVMGIAGTEIVARYVATAQMVRHLVHGEVTPELAEDSTAGLLRASTPWIELLTELTARVAS